MRHLLLAVLAALMIGCEPSPPILDNTFAEFQVTDKEVTSPEVLPKLIPLDCFPEEGDGCQIAGWTSTDSIDTFENYKIISESNTEIAQANAEGLQTAIEEIKELVYAGREQEKITQIREEQLQFERTQRQIEKWYYRVMLVLVGAAGVYASQ